jgi:hypothetical protein
MQVVKSKVQRGLGLDCKLLGFVQKKIFYFFYPFFSFVKGIE